MLEDEFEVFSFDTDSNEKEIIISENKTLSFKIGYVDGRKMVELKTKPTSEYSSNFNLVMNEYYEGYKKGKQDAILKK